MLHFQWQNRCNETEKPRRRRRKGVTAGDRRRPWREGCGGGEQEGEGLTLDCETGRGETDLGEPWRWGDVKNRDGHWPKFRTGKTGKKGGGGTRGGIF